MFGAVSEPLSYPGKGNIPITNSALLETLFSAGLPSAAPAKLVKLSAIGEPVLGGREWCDRLEPTGFWRSTPGLGLAGRYERGLCHAQRNDSDLCVVACGKRGVQRSVSRTPRPGLGDAGGPCHLERCKGDPCHVPRVDEPERVEEFLHLTEQTFHSRRDSRGKSTNTGPLEPATTLTTPDFVRMPPGGIPQLASAMPNWADHGLVQRVFIKIFSERHNLRVMPGRYWRCRA
ncbi:hypothetical protein SAMN05421504_1011076 [Amycolatopsis xylanica]|uniref:Uncharacterized protein n=1 Tax=Amycolatopsis xylanica TaxID=589385 RepID=A0A1H2V2T7_9PSEU|nr:hypothetical protein SAMN05421504_1011076 [Amycolatopsis xylanica]